MAISQPNNTLYVKNIDWKIKTSLLKRALYSLFSRHGKVLEIVALRKDGLRGQAFVIFDDVQSATLALQHVQGFTFFGKDMALEYAKEKSDRIARRDGTFVPKAKRRKVAVKEEEPPATTSEADQTPAIPEDNTPPSKYLLALNLPSDANEMVLAMIFRNYAGFKEVRLPRPGLAFVEFDDEPHATLAKKALQGFSLSDTVKLHLVYGKE